MAQPMPVRPHLADRRQLKRGPVNEDEWSPLSERDERRREDDLRVRMVALDMSITALPQYVSPVDSEETRGRTQAKLIKTYEKYLRTGEL